MWCEREELRGAIKMLNGTSGAGMHEFVARKAVFEVDSFPDVKVGSAGRKEDTDSVKDIIELLADISEGIRALVDNVFRDGWAALASVVLMLNWEMS